MDFKLLENVSYLNLEYLTDTIRSLPEKWLNQWIDIYANVYRYKIECH
jgi:hypothetical protein